MDLRRARCARSLNEELWEEVVFRYKKGITRCRPEESIGRFTDDVENAELDSYCNGPNELDLSLLCRAFM
jgi:hypothetical protein